MDTEFVSGDTGNHQAMFYPRMNDFLDRVVDQFTDRNSYRAGLSLPHGAMAPGGQVDFQLGIAGGQQCDVDGIVVSWRGLLDHKLSLTEIAAGNRICLQTLWNELPEIAGTEPYRSLPLSCPTISPGNTYPHFQLVQGVLITLAHVRR